MAPLSITPQGFAVFRIIEKGILADGLVVKTIVKKYCAHSPLYRQAAGIGRDVGVELGHNSR